MHAIAAKSFRPRHPVRLAALAACMLLASGARAAVRDPQLQALADAHKTAEVEQAAAARIAARPDDGAAWLAYTEAVLESTGADAEARRTAALARLNACVQKTPQVAACHYGIGAVTGVQIMAQGMMKAAFGIGSVRDEFTKALELDPSFAPARAGLVQFYLMVPGLAGGSVSKARDIAQAEGRRAPEYGKVLDAMVLAYQDRPADAERVLATVQPGADLELAEELRGQWVAIGFGWLQQKKPANARAVFERLAKERPEQPDAHYGLGRALADLQQWDAAVAELKAAAALPGHESLPVDYRLGVALQGKGDAAQARAAFTRYLASANPNPKNVDDARKRLSDLGS
jgi:tetratricopeptide (TPR) repeat protein